MKETNTNMEYDESNKLIAKYMGGYMVGAEEYESPQGSHSKGTIERWKFNNSLHFDKDSYQIGLFDYHSNWNKIMDVIDKLEREDSLLEFKISSRECMIMYDKKMYDKYESDSRIESVYWAVSDYIKYNC